MLKLASTQTGISPNCKSFSANQSPITRLSSDCCTQFDVLSGNICCQKFPLTVTPVENSTNNLTKNNTNIKPGVGGRKLEHKNGAMLLRLNILPKLDAVEIDKFEGTQKINTFVTNSTATCKSDGLTNIQLSFVKNTLASDVTNKIFTCNSNNSLTLSPENGAYKSSTVSTSEKNTTNMSDLEKSIPKIHNGKRVGRCKSDLGYKPNSTPKVEDIISYKTDTSVLTFALTSKGYILLCSTPNCKGSGQFEDVKCSKHRESYTKCRYPDCKSRPTFGVDVGKPLFCKSHKHDDMKDVVHGSCKHPGCKTRANFGYTWMHPICCKAHKGVDMKDVVHKRCDHPKCKTRPSFGFTWNEPTHCKAHKLENMEDVANKRCQHPKCKTIPSFGNTWNKPTHCKVHKLENMGDVINKRCRYPECNTLPSFGYTRNDPIYCKIHKFGDMEDVKSKRCQHLDCKTRPSFGYIWIGPIYCSAHKLEDMEDVVSNQCQHPECKTHPSFGYTWMHPIYCKAHKDEDMENVVDKRCQHFECKTLPSFGNTWMDPVYCKAHKLENMEDVVSKRCQHFECKTRPNFGYTCNEPIYCKAHKLEDMKDVVNKRCQHLNCETLPSFGYTWMEPVYCKAHKLENMKDVVNKRCQHLNCETLPSFGYTWMEPVYCKAHKLENMKNVKNKRCQHAECKTQPSFGYNWNNPLYCKDHKSDDMKDVINERCQHPDCEIQPSFGYTWMHPIYCNFHRTEEMKNVVSKQCRHPECKSRPSFGYNWMDPVYCKDHKNQDMEDVVHKRCQQLECETRPCYLKLFSTSQTHCREHSTLNEFSSRKNYPKCKRGNCDELAYWISMDDKNLYPVRCVTHKLSTDIKLIESPCEKCKEIVYFPENQRFCMECGQYREKVLYHFKESMVRFLFESNYINFIYNKITSPNGSRYRPDFTIKANFGYVIVEVDEHQHDTYDPDQELYRMQTIYNDVQLIDKNKQVLFIRYNPDYKGKNLSQKQREQRLCNLVKYWILQPDLKTDLGVMYLFYDNKSEEIQSLSLTMAISNSTIIDEDELEDNYHIEDIEEIDEEYSEES
jgi:hypothetical protein